MGAGPGRLQSAFTAGELSPLLWSRHDVKYHNAGLRFAENIAAMPQGGFTLRDGTRHVDVVESDASRIFPFDASTGEAFDLVLSDLKITPFGQTTADDPVTSPYPGAALRALTAAQQLDTGLFFNPDYQPRRLKFMGGGAWAIEPLPLDNLPLYDYGGSYTNGTAAVWELEFVGFTSGSPSVSQTVFVLTVNGQDTTGLYPADGGSGTDLNETITAATIQNAILALPGIKPGITAAASGTNRIRVTFGGTDNLGDGWAISGKVLNKAEAAIVANKVTVGEEPGEPIVSDEQGWPACAAFYLQRLILGGLKGLPNTFLFSIIADYFNFDTRLDQANGAFVLPMNTPGGEAVRQLVPGRNLLALSSHAQYWLKDTEISKTKPPELVQSQDRIGVRQGVPVVESEGAAIFCSASGSVLSEFRYTDIEGNYETLPISLLASHLVEDVRDQTIRRAVTSDDGHTLAVVLNDGSLRLATLLRQQEVTAFSRVGSNGSFVAASCNGRNEISLLVDRNGSRRLERLEPGLLLDAARSVSPSGQIVEELDDLEGLDVWAIADDEVFGPLTVEDGAIALPVPVSGQVEVGLWSPPVAKTLPISRMVGPNIWLQRPARIHTVHLHLEDTTSVAVGVGDGTPRALNLRRYGDEADVPELAQGFSGIFPVRGLRGFSADPYVTITQLRPGRLTVTGIVIEAKL